MPCPLHIGRCMGEAHMPHCYIHRVAGTHQFSTQPFCFSVFLLINTKTVEKGQSTVISVCEVLKGNALMER